MLVCSGFVGMRLLGSLGQALHAEAGAEREHEWSVGLGLQRTDRKRSVREGRGSEQQITPVYPVCMFVCMCEVQEMQGLDIAIFSNAAALQRGCLFTGVRDARNAVLYLAVMTATQQRTMQLY